jgi:transglutaminase-like putative cysteine protease
VADDPQSGSVDREPGRFLLVVCCLLAATATAGLVASTGATGLAGSPLDSLLPGGDVSDYRVTDSASDPLAGVGNASNFGALDPGDSTGVGGDTGFDSDTFASNDTAVHFVAESPRATYWRTGAYSTYTGRGWERETDTDAIDDTVDHRGQADERIEYEVELKRPATALPTPWRPETVSGIEGRVTESGSIQAAGRVERGTTFSGTSAIPERDPALLRTAGTGYPESVADRYTDLPARVPDRVADLTASVSADATTPFDTALAVQTWLRANKSYSLQASAQSPQIVDTFLFQMDRGYCEYFATAMTVMLRTQDIPARYVVGYSSGQQVGEDSYEVRGMNAHAWVEVYFPEYGWVTFDPTPGDSRLAAQADVLDETYDPQEPGSPGETFQPGEITDETDPDDSDETDPGDDNTDDSEDERSRISLNETPVPGERVTVTASADERPLESALVSFNGERVGRTDARGTVTGTVPETELLRVAVRPVSAPLGVDITENFSVETDATVAVTGETLPGADVTVTALLDGQPLAGATVSLNGEPAARTDARGRATVTLPDRTGKTTVAVRRGPVDGEQTVSLPALSVTVESDLPVALPLGPATLTARYGDAPAAGVPVFINGKQVAETGPDGTATLRFPPAPSATVAAGTEPIQDTSTVGGLAVNLATVLCVTLGPLVLAVVLVRFRDRVRAALWAAVGGVANAPAVGRRLVDTVVAAGSDGRAAAASLATGLWRALAARLPSGETADDRSRATDEPRETVREGWQQFLDHVSVPAATRTPDELAAHATERDGLPEEAVTTIRDGFRAVEYGSRSPETWADRVEEAVETIRAADEEGET